MLWKNQVGLKENKLIIEWSSPVYIHTIAFNTEKLEDLDFADDLALLTHTCQQMQEKSGKVVELAALLRLKTNSSKNEIMRINSRKNTSIIINQKQLEDIAPSNIVRV